MSTTSLMSDSAPDDGKPRMDEDTYRAMVLCLWNQGKHFEAMKLLWRDKVIDCPPTRLLVKALAAHPRLLVMGHGSASKTFTTMAFKLLKWCNNPSKTGLALTSATMKSLSSRAWADLLLLHRDSVVPMPGIPYQSIYEMRYDRLDKKNKILCVSGEDEDSVTKIQGFHPENIDLVIDEADNEYNIAIWNAIANLSTSGEFTVVGLANPMDRNSPFGMNAEPIGGWDSVNINESFEWESRNGYHVVRLDGLESPNIQADEVLYPFLLTPRGVSAIEHEFGQNSPNYMTYVRAWFPDSGSVNTIFSGTLVTQMERQEMRFYGETVPVAACDPSLGGGNRCVLGIGRAGVLAENPSRGCVELEKIIYIKHNDPSKPVTHDFAEQIRDACKDHGVSPENFAIGASTADVGIRDYLVEFWDRKIVSIDPNGNAGRVKILQEDSRLPEDRFDRKITEMMWACREWVKAGQLAVRCLSRDLRIQMEARRWGNTSGNKLKIEFKDDMKKRGLKSPDEFDMVANLVDLARGKFGDIEATNLSFDPKLRREDVLPEKSKGNLALFQPQYKEDAVLHEKVGEDGSLGGRNEEDAYRRSYESSEDEYM